MLNQAARGFLANAGNGFQGGYHWNLILLSHLNCMSILKTLVSCHKAYPAKGKLEDMWWVGKYRILYQILGDKLLI